MAAGAAARLREVAEAVAVVVAAVVAALPSGSCAPPPGSDFPSRTCIAGRRYRSVARVDRVACLNRTLVYHGPAAALDDKDLLGRLYGAGRVVIAHGADEPPVHGH